MSAASRLAEIQTRLKEKTGLEIQEATALAGGSINDVYLIQTTAGPLVLKVNDHSRFPGMFEAEQKGLQVLKNTQSFEIPEVLSVSESNNKAFLLMEYKPEGAKSQDFWEIFAEKLTILHRSSSSEFGFPSNNFIGSLPQYNERCSSAGEFYIHQRLEPQIRMARDRGFGFEELETILKNISAEIPEEAPSLVHGDLWNGNYLVTQDGSPCLIDPAVAYAPREMDLAMMKLFGGFPQEVFSIYQELFPLSPGFEKRVDLWQLYYLLVHLNIFGSSYLPSVRDILNNFK